MHVTVTFALALSLLVSSAHVAAQNPPQNLAAQVQPGASVLLTWDPPVAGLFEDFEDGVADEFAFDPEDAWIVEDGHLAGLPGQTWKSAWYTADEFTDFVLETTFTNVSGTNSRGLLFRGDGPRDDDYNGYAFYIAYNAQNFSLYSYVNGDLDLISGWTPSDLINMDPGEQNTISVVAFADEFSLFINGEFVAQATDGMHDTGTVGVVSTASNEVWYEQIQCVPDEEFVGLISARAGEPLFPADERPADSDYDDRGRGPSHTARAGRETVPARKLLQPPHARELDEFVEFAVYRDGELIANTTATAYADQLPGAGSYQYTVTAIYDPEGESAPAGPVTVTWPPVELAVTPQDTIVPAAGGSISYDLAVSSALAVGVPGVTYWTNVILPNGQSLGPLFEQTFTMPPYMDVTIEGITQTVPAAAPAGAYIHRSKLGFYPNAQIVRQFAFVKLGAASGVGPGGDWRAYGPPFDRSPAGTNPGEPETAALGDPRPNPFNAAVSVPFTLPSAAEVQVEVVDVAGRHVATLVRERLAAGRHLAHFDGSEFASGLYFVRLIEVNGGRIDAKKLLLVK